MNNPVELPTLEQIEAMDQQRTKATESLEIVNDQVKCQNCNSLQPIQRPLTNSQYSSRIYQLQARIKQIERHHIGGTSAKKEREELKLLLEEHDKKDILRRIPLYSSSITSYRFYCSECYDKAYLLSTIRKKS
jgi:ribonuclease D